MTRAFLGLGGNVGDTRALLDRAIDALCDGVGTVLTDRSAAYRTPPWGDTDQPPFINLCIAVETRLPPRALLDRAHTIERSLGRDRRNERRWGPRTVDIDILWYEGAVMDEPDLVLPHPRLFERPFVLIPLSDIAGDAQIAGRSVRDAAAAADRDGIEKLPPA